MRRMAAASKAVLQRLGMRIRELREAEGLSQERVSDLAGVTRTYLNQIEHGSRNVGIVTLVMIAIALRTTPSDLLSVLTKPVLRNLPEG